MQKNTPLELASEFAHHTNKNIFLTGKAGTGKTTFLLNLKKTLHKRMAIVAPTGVAAINAGGITIHSFFQLPFAPYIPGSQPGAQRQFHFTTEKINLIKSLDLLVIDEISMVRADTLDSIDEVLRRYRDRHKPFGGVQLLMIGDLHQLSPVIKGDEGKMLRNYYDSFFFFGSKALAKTDPVRIELTHIYRQSDTFFIDLLNRVRENKLDDETLRSLNQRYLPNFEPADDEGYITLTARNDAAQQINRKKLEELPGSMESFEAVVKGVFPFDSYPTESNLELKEGAQVMFIKNDTSRDKLYYNGKIGQISRIEDDVVFVKSKGEYMDIEVRPSEWQNVKYILNPETKEIEERLIGSFTQYPLRLAWAITIHKSQGLTFDKAIVDAGNSFAHGQVYVALSRCKSFEGMVLRSAIGRSSIKTDGTVAAYNKETNENIPDAKKLADSKVEYQRSLMLELFDFSEIKRTLYTLNRSLSENESSIRSGALARCKTIMGAAETDIYPIAERFREKLSKQAAGPALPENDRHIQERIQKASSYFLEKLEIVEKEGKALEIETDNKAIKKTVDQALESYLRAVFIKKKSLAASMPLFKTDLFLRARSNAEIDFKAAPSSAGSTRKPKDVPHGALYVALREWRNSVASERDLSVYMVLPQKSLQELVKLLPTTLGELELVKGIGKTKVKHFGKEIVEIIREYCEENRIQKNTAAIAAKRKEDKEKLDTKRSSLELFKSGKVIREVAIERGMAYGTIEGHLIHFIGTGELDIYSVFKKENIDQVIAYLEENRVTSLTQIKAALGETISYSEIRAVQLYLRNQAE